MRRTHDSQPGEQSPDLRLRATVGDRETFGFHTADSVHSPDAFRPAELRLLDALVEDPRGSLLVSQANYGVVGTVMAEFVDRVRMTERRASRARLCRVNARVNGVDATSSVALTATPDAVPETVECVAYAPPAYAPCAVVEQRLADALATLSPGGVLLLAAPMGGGARRYRAWIESRCPSVRIMHDGSDVLVLRASRPETVDEERIAEPRTLRPSIEGVELTLVSYPGLFSATELDDGTRFLAKSIDFRDGERILDLACGYGPLGLYAARSADCEVTLTDDDRVATACARRSAELSSVPAVEVVTADGVTGVRHRSFDRVLCNPPTHAGSAVLRDLLEGTHLVLADDGRLDLVHHGGVDIGQHLEPFFDRIESVVREDYRLVTATA